MISRRRFVSLTGTAVAAGGLATSIQAVEPWHRPGRNPRMRLALAAYSFRDELAAGKDGTPAKMKMEEFIDYCAEHNVPGAELTSYYFKPNPDDAYWAGIRRHAHLRGVTVSGTAVGNNFTHPAGAKRSAEIAAVKRWIERASVFGAPHIRVFAGGASKELTPAEAKKNCIEALEECGELAGQHGIFLGLENHGGIVAEANDLLEIVRAVKSPWVGINLDTGNFHTDDPWGDLAKCAPYAVNVQYKGYIRARGEKSPQLPEASRTVKLLKDAGYSGWVALEYELSENPKERVPRMLEELRTALAG